MLLYSRKKVRYRRDGYCWKKRKDGKTTREDHMKLKVQGMEVKASKNRLLNCLYTVWPDVGRKSSQIIHKSCPKSTHRGLFFWKCDAFLSRPKRYQIIGLLLQEKLLPTHFKSSPIIGLRYLLSGVILITLLSDLSIEHHTKGAFTQSVLRGVIRRRLGHLKNKKIFFSVNKRPFYAA